MIDLDLNLLMIEWQAFIQSNLKLLMLRQGAAKIKGGSGTSGLASEG